MKKRILAVIFAGAFACAALAGCGSSSSTTSTAASEAEETVESAVEEETADEESVAEDTTSTETTEAAATVGDLGAFEEQQITNTDGDVFEDEEVGFISMNGVYFQAVSMAPGYEDIGDATIHIEVDVKAMENDLGFGVGDWIPYLQVSYSITDPETGDVVTGADGQPVEGNFMPMSASDGPHYGQNIALEPGTYNFNVSIQPDTSYVIHLGSETGPGGTWDEYFADGALTYTFENWAFPGLDA